LYDLDFREKVIFGPKIRYFNNDDFRRFLKSLKNGSNEVK